MSDLVKMQSPLESSRRIILAKAVSMAFDRCAEPDDPREIASLAAHFAIEMMRTLHKDDELQREKEYHAKLGIAYLTMQTPSNAGSI